jgi:excisionase family DNA binding protein
VSPLETDISSLLPPDRATLRPQEIATILDCSVQHICNLIETGELGAINLGQQSARHVRVPTSEYIRFLRARDLRKKPQ